MPRGRNLPNNENDCLANHISRNKLFSALFAKHVFQHFDTNKSITTFLIKARVKYIIVILTKTKKTELEFLPEIMFQALFLEACAKHYYISCTMLCKQIMCDVALCSYQGSGE